MNRLRISRLILICGYNQGQLNYNMTAGNVNIQLKISTWDKLSTQVLKMNDIAHYDWLKKHLAEKIERMPDGFLFNEAIGLMVKMDPTQKNEYLKYLAQIYVSGNLKLNDNQEFIDALNLFHRIKKSLNNKDVYQFSSEKELIDWAKGRESIRAKRRSDKKLGAKIIINTADFKAIQLFTMEAAIEYGKGTQWCTASTKSDNDFYDYLHRGEMFVIIAGNRKFKLGMFLDMFTDEENTHLLYKPEDITYLSSFPEYKNFLNYMLHRYCLDAKPL